MKIIIIVKKNSDFIELESIIDFYKPDHLHLFALTSKNNDHFNNFAKGFLKSLVLKFKKRVLKIEESFFYIDEVKNGKDIYNKLSPFIDGKCVIGLPLANGRFFLDSVKYFNKNPNVVVCHVKDGMLDFIPRHKYFFKKYNLSFINIFKCVFLYFKLINSLSHVSFSIYSSYSAFSKKTIKTKPNCSHSSVARETIDEVMPLLSKLKNGILLIPSQRVSAELLVSHFKLHEFIDRIIISSKFGVVTMNNKEHWANTPISAEELLQTGYISEVYAGPSTAAFYAKELNFNINTTILSTYEQKKLYGFAHIGWIKKQSLRYNIKFIDLENSLSSSNIK
jgi:hypothetical protein